MQEFEKSKRAIMTNARCLTEGVDVPDIDCVLFADPKKSTIDIVQAVGRALRLSEGKKFGYVIVPVIIEDDKQFAESDAFQSILMTLRALASNDERIIDYFRARSQKKRTHTNVQIEVDERIAEKVDVEDFTRELELQIWNKLAKLSWRQFNEARSFARSLFMKGTQNSVHITWKGYCHDMYEFLPPKPPDIPSNPNIIYQDIGWKSYKDWFGYDDRYWSYDEAKSFVRKLDLKNTIEWKDYCKGKFKDRTPKPYEIPYKPERVYKKRGIWISMGDFLGTGFVSSRKRKYRSFNSARAYARKLGLDNSRQWWDLMKNKPRYFPKDIPSSVESVYNEEWTNWPDFLGYSIWLDFDKARDWARRQKISNKTNWKNHMINNRPKGMPLNPQMVYVNVGWKGWIDWLGPKAEKYYSNHPLEKRTYIYRRFNDARKFARQLRLKSVVDWHSFCGGFNKELEPRPDDIPKTPNKVYKNKGWKGYPDFLGYEPKRKKKKT
jgi:hypothetical protein